MKLEKIEPMDLLNQAWLLPVILRGLRSEVWLQPNTKLYSIWLDLGLFEQVENLLAMHPTLEYEFSSMIKHVLGTPVIEDTEDEAEMLEISLKRYRDFYIKESFQAWLLTVFTPKGEDTKAPKTVFDYTGKEDYVEYINNVFPLATKYLATPNSNIEGGSLTIDEFLHVDVMSYPEWYKKDQNSFDLITLIDYVSDCEPQAWDYLLESSEYMLSKGGLLVVGDKVPRVASKWQRFTKGITGMDLERTAFDNFVAENCNLELVLSCEVSGQWFPAYKNN